MAWTGAWLPSVVPPLLSAEHAIRVSKLLTTANNCNVFFILFFILIYKTEAKIGLFCKNVKRKGKKKRRFL